MARDCVQARSCGSRSSISTVRRRSFALSNPKAARTATSCSRPRCSICCDNGGRCAGPDMIRLAGSHHHFPQFISPAAVPQKQLESSLLAPARSGQDQGDAIEVRLAKCEIAQRFDPSAKEVGHHGFCFGTLNSYAACTRVLPPGPRRATEREDRSLQSRSSLP